MDKEKIKEEYESSELELEVLIKEEMTKIRERVKMLEAEAERIGEETEKRLRDKKIKKAGK
jgi:hypothetical protein